MSTVTPPDVLAHLEELEKPIRTTDAQSIPARWHSGRYMLDMRGGKKQLPRGVRAELAQMLQVSRSEISARMQFAEQYDRDEKVSDAIRTFRTWYRITHEALTDKPRAPRRAPQAKKSAIVQFRDELKDKVNSGAAVTGEDAKALAEIAQLILRVKDMATAQKNKAA